MLAGARSGRAMAALEACCCFDWAALCLRPACNPVPAWPCLMPAHFEIISLSLLPGLWKGRCWKVTQSHC